MAKIAKKPTVFNLGTMILIRVPWIDLIWFTVIDRRRLIRVSLIFFIRFFAWFGCRRSTVSDLAVINWLYLIPILSICCGFHWLILLQTLRHLLFFDGFLSPEDTLIRFCTSKIFERPVGSLITLTKQNYLDL